LSLHDDVQRGRWFIREENFWSTRDCHRQRRTLAHASGQLVRKGDATFAGNTYSLEKHARLLDSTAPRLQAMKGENIRDLFLDRYNWIQGIHCALKDNGDVPPSILSQRTFSLSEKVLSLEANSSCDPRIRWEQAHERKENGCLSAPGLPDEPEPFAGKKIEADAPNGVNLASATDLEPDMEVFGCENRRGH
jgi:hypothetical protein